MIVKKIKIKEHQMCRPHTESSIIKSISPYLQHNLFSPVLSRIAAVGLTAGAGGDQRVLIC